MTMSRQTTRKMTRTKRKNSPRHPFSSGGHLIRVTLLVCICAALAAGPVASLPVPEAPAPPALAAAEARAKLQDDGAKKKGPAEDFLIFGTVFHEQGFALAGAKVEVRRAGEKKVRGRAISDRRGEFGIRVPVGAEYEVRIEARGFAAHERKVDGKQGQRFDFVARLQPEGKTPAKGEGEKKP